MTNENIAEGLYIPSIECAWLKKFNAEDGNYKVNEKYLDKLLNGKLDYSFELVENKDLIEEIEIKEIDGKKYTLDIVNVKYNNKYMNKINKKVVGQMTTKQLRDWSYQDGFNFNDNAMSNWKRSTGKSRVGENMFILSSIRDKCLDWGRMGLKFTGKVDIGSIRAYESLPLSSIIGEITINPENILVIADFESKFDWTMSKTYLVDKELKTETIKTEESNSIWDGEGILSEKIFQQNEIIQGHSVALLRNRYMKCAGFAGRIELFFKDYIDKANAYNELHNIESRLDYNTFTVKDMYNNDILVKNIELITTPSAIKLAKYNHVVLAEKLEYAKFAEGAWLQYWKDNCGTNFGVCKVDKASYLCEKDEDGNITNYRNTLSYQHVNTIPFTQEELNFLVAEDKAYVERLKEDLDFFLQEVNKNDNDNDDEIENEFKISSNIDVTGAFIELSKKKPEFEQTQVFKDYRRNYIAAYVNKLRSGKIHINNCDYVVACGNPIELFKATVGEFNKDNTTSTLNNNELYCSRFKEDGVDVVGFRNPHILVSNCGLQKQKYVQEIEDYMVTSPSIVYLNSINYPILSVYNGEDFDIDSNLLTTDKTIVTACKRIITDGKESTIATPIPFNDIQPSKKNELELNELNMSKVDTIIAENYIGSVINLSMEINSKMNDIRFKNPNADEKTQLEINNLFDRVSKLSSISQTEIDKSKRQFESLNVPKELEKMKTEMKLVDNDKVLEVRAELEIVKKELSDKKFEVNNARNIARKPLSKEIRVIQNVLRINALEKLTAPKITTLTNEMIELENKLQVIENANNVLRNPISKQIKTIKNELSEGNIKKLTQDEILKFQNKLEGLKFDLTLIIDKEDKVARKLITKPLGVARKILQEDAVEKLTEVQKLELTNRIVVLDHDMEIVNNSKQSEIDDFKTKVNVKSIELTNLDKRRIKPYFFKFVGDNDSKKQRKTANKKHRKELDRPIIEKFAKNNKIEISEVDKKNKELAELLKVNKDIQKEWIEQGYDRKMETPMNWLELELDTIKNSKKIGTVQVIQLVTKSKHKANSEKVNSVMDNIKELDNKITGYKADVELNSKDKFNKIKFAKEETVKFIKKVDLKRGDMFGVMQQGLNSVKKEKKKIKVNVKSGIESITLEILFKTFGTKLLDMFL
ncbi:MAG TPA: hypothetical protein VIK86_05675 [Candidatus Paceibacterota bacterium]